MKVAYFDCPSGASADMICIGLARLGVEAVHCSALPIGGGFANSAHGRIPIPAPGTAELLRGMPLVDTGCGGSW